mmetsp:Transcript_8756/g.32303  ORF Transcript_8756/g.32303 Transcript_8756/m.32303 type:complete len:472 (+) Transcript_8756:105-1520(+)
MGAHGNASEGAPAPPVAVDVPASGTQEAGDVAEEARDERALEAIRAAQKALGKMEKIWNQSSFAGPSVPQLDFGSRADLEEDAQVRNAQEEDAMLQTAKLWERAYDPSSKQWYFVQTQTRETSWTPPDGVPLDLIPISSLSKLPGDPESATAGEGDRSAVGNQPQYTENPEWYYEDLQGVTQGPFSQVNLVAWLAAGLLDSSLMLWRTPAGSSSTDSMLLGELARRSEAETTPNEGQTQTAAPPTLSQVASGHGSTPTAPGGAAVWRSDALDTDSGVDESTGWYYRDLEGVVQGPFRLVVLTGWRREGLLSGLLNVWQKGEGEKNAATLDSVTEDHADGHASGGGQIDYAGAVYSGMQSAAVDEPATSKAEPAGGSKYVEYTEQLHYNKISGRLQRKENFLTDHDIKEQASLYFDNSLDHWCDTTKLAEHFEHQKQLKGKKLPKHLVKKMIERKRHVKEKMRKQGNAWLSS